MTLQLYIWQKFKADSKLTWYIIEGTEEQGLEVLEECHSLSLAAGGSSRSLFTFLKIVVMVMWRNCILPPSQNDAFSNQVRLPILHQVLPHLLQRPQRPQPGLSFHLGHGENWLLETFLTALLMVRFCLVVSLLQRENLRNHNIWFKNSVEEKLLIHTQPMAERSFLSLCFLLCIAFAISIKSIQTEQGNAAISR